MSKAATSTTSTNLTTTKKRRHKGFVDRTQDELDEQVNDVAIVYGGQFFAERHLESLQWHRNLTRLTLVKCWLTRQHLKIIAQLKLIHLNVRENAFGDIGCEEIARMERLESLNVGRCGIHASGVHLLMGLNWLRALIIDNNRFTHQGARLICIRRRREEKTYRQQTEPVDDTKTVRIHYAPEVPLAQLDISGMTIPIHLLRQMAEYKWDLLNFTYVDTSMRELQRTLNRNVSKSISWTHRLVLPDFQFETKLEKYNHIRDRKQKMLWFIVAFCLSNKSSCLVQSIIDICLFGLCPLIYQPLRGEDVKRWHRRISSLVSLCLRFDFQAKK